MSDIDKLTIPGYVKCIAATRFIEKNTADHEDINFLKDGAQLFLMSFNPGEKRPLHKHPELRITFIRDGKARFIIEDEERIAGPGDMLITKPYIEHSLEVLGEEPLIFAELVMEDE